VCILLDRHHHPAPITTTTTTTTTTATTHPPSTHHHHHSPPIATTTTPDSVSAHILNQRVLPASTFSTRYQDGLLLIINFSLHRTPLTNQHHRVAHNLLSLGTFCSLVVKV
jgi:hypothetical protein